MVFDLKTKDVVDRLKRLWGFNQDKLADFLEVGKSSVTNYKKRATTDIQTRMIARLLEMIEWLQKENEVLRKQVDVQHLAELLNKENKE